MKAIGIRSSKTQVALWYQHNRSYHVRDGGERLYIAAIHYWATDVVFVLSLGNTKTCVLRETSANTNELKWVNHNPTFRPPPRRVLGTRTNPSPHLTDDPLYAFCAQNNAATVAAIMANYAEHPVFQSQYFWRKHVVKPKSVKKQKVRDTDTYWVPTRVCRWLRRLHRMSSALPSAPHKRLLRILALIPQTVSNGS